MWYLCYDILSFSIVWHSISISISINIYFTTHQVEAYLGYAHWVCHTLLSIPNDQTSCVTKGKPYADLSHLPRKLRSTVLVASVALTKYLGWFK